jgi:hypothetical protein
MKYLYKNSEPEMELSGRAHDKHVLDSKFEIHMKKIIKII